jgi:Na+/H+ antiporter NhaD/arsenite permease-like protein
MNQPRFIKYYIFLILVVKIIVLFLVISSFLINKSIENKPEVKQNYSHLLKIYSKSKEQFHFIFGILMAILLIILFNPYTKNPIILNNEDKIILWLFGYVLIISADWSNFMHDWKIIVKDLNNLDTDLNNFKQSINKLKQKLN